MLYNEQNVELRDESFAALLQGRCSGVTNDGESGSGWLC